MNSWVLIGFKASGKSSVGQALAKRLELPFFDTDAMVEKTVGRSCRSIVETGGLEVLAAYECEVLNSLGTGVIATGGATCLDEENGKLLQGLGRLIYLQASFETVQGRIEVMPAYCESWDDLKKHYEARCPRYLELADRVVQVDGKSIEEIVWQVTALEKSFE